MVPTGARTQQNPPPGTAIARSPGGGAGIATRSRARAVTRRLPTRGRSGIDGVPPAYDDGLQWLMNGWARHPIGVTVALLAGWTGVWLSLWGAVFGALEGLLIAVGVITNPGVSSALFHLGLGQSVTAVGIVSGLALGALGGFLDVLSGLWSFRTSEILIPFLAGAVIAGMVLLNVAAFERLGLRIRGYRRLSRDEVRRVAPLVKQVADAMELPALPRFAMADTVVPNAWTHMRTVVLSSGLLDSLRDDELQGVLAHELHHWSQGDAVGLRLVWVGALPLALIYDFGLWLAGSTRSPVSPETFGIQLPQGLLAIAGWLIAWPAWVMTKFVIVPVVAASQRRYEYQADAAAGEIGLAIALSSALRKMGAFETGRTGWEQAIAATHPPVELRLEALQLPRPDDAEYQETELGGPTASELRRIYLFWRRS